MALDYWVVSIACNWSFWFKLVLQGLLWYSGLAHWSQFKFTLVTNQASIGTTLVFFFFVGTAQCSTNERFHKLNLSNFTLASNIEFIGCSYKLKLLLIIHYNIVYAFWLQGVVCVPWWEQYPRSGHTIH